MDLHLSAEESRILGALIEKEITTPEYYPMRLTALVSACNQKSCRDPVMAFTEESAAFHLDILRDEKSLVSLVSAAGSRVARYRQRLTETFFFTPPERAVLCELMLRGPQTPGELKNRAARMHPFAGVEEVLAALKELETRADGPWVCLLPRLPGHKEARYAHLLSGKPEAANEVSAETTAPHSSAPGPSPLERMARLEADVARLGAGLDELAAELKAFREQVGG